ncbi:MAG TPA: hypothetical protein VIV07_09265 [Sphingomicrobium sp.]
MRRAIFLLAGAAALSACGQSGGDEPNQATATAKSAAAKPKPAYCFFQPNETKGWAASRDKAGNVVVKGKAYREDSRYQALLGPPSVTGTTAEISPTIQQNPGAYGAPDDWWDVSATIPNSAAVETVNVTCGGKTIAQLTVPRTK